LIRALRSAGNWIAGRLTIYREIRKIREVYREIEEINGKSDLPDRRINKKLDLPDLPELLVNNSLSSL
jgi:hypothetical protein